MKPCSIVKPDARDSSGAINDSRRANIDAASDNSSFLRREAELVAVEERFRDSHLRKGRLTPVESKFREVFYEGPGPANRKPLRCRLRLTIPSQGTGLDLGTYDSTDSQQPSPSPPPSNGSDSRSDRGLESSIHGHLAVPSSDHYKRNSKSKGLSPQYHPKGGRSSRGFSSSKDGDETAEMWKRALRAESVSRPARSSTSAHKSESSSLRGGPRNSERISRASKAREHSHHSGANSHEHSPTCIEVPPPDEDDRVLRSLVRSTTVLEEWSRQLEEQEREAKSNTRALASTFRATGKGSMTPPASWAKFPSHDRDQRNAAAGPEDHVKLRDFAVKEFSARGQVAWTTDRDEADELSRKKMIRSFSDRFSQPFKSRWSKLLPNRTTSPSTDRSMLGKRRSSLQTSGDLEYPELELLPTAGGYKELRALERDINEMKRRTGPNKRASSDGVAARPSLTDRMNNMSQHDGVFESASNTNSCCGSMLVPRPTSPTCRHLSTPADGMKSRDTESANELTGSSGQRYVTPLTHMSQSPCGSSRAVLFSTSDQAPTTALPSTSSRTSISVVRRSSMDGLSGQIISTVAICRCSSWSGRGSIKRQAAPLLTTPVSP